MILELTKIVMGGECLAVSPEGKKILVKGGIPGEKVEAEVYKVFPDFDVAKVTKIIEKSPYRVEPVCPNYGKCGGCNMMHISIDAQKIFRKEILKDCFLREGFSEEDIENAGGIEIIEGNPVGYRCRFQFKDGSLNERESNSLIKLEYCPVATNPVNEYLKTVPQEKRPKGRIHFFGDERIFSEGKKTESQFSKIFIANEEKASKEMKIVGKTKKQIKDKSKKRFTLNVPVESNVCTVGLKVLDSEDSSLKMIKFDVQGFFQSNLEVLEKTISKTMEGLGGNRVLDMYSGCGTFSVFLKDRFKKTIMVEHNRQALVFAEMNMAGSGHESYGVSGENFIKNCLPLIEKNVAKENPDNPEIPVFDAVVIDPPRSGMEKEVCKWLASSNIPVIKHVSCNPATLARDVKFLCRGGYKIKKIYLADFYPQTSEIEALVELVKN